MISYSTDTQNELELIRKLAKESGAFEAVICNHWAKGGAGATDLAAAVERACQAQSDFKFLYDLNVSTCLLYCFSNIFHIQMEFPYILTNLLFFGCSHL